MRTKSPFLNSVVEYMYSRHYAKKSIETYIGWIAAYINFHNKRHPASMGNNEVELFLNHLVVTKNVAARTQATALNSLVFLYKHIIQKELTLELSFIKSSRQQKLPIILTPSEVSRLIFKVKPILNTSLRSNKIADYNKRGTSRLNDLYAYLTLL